jgi:hypothetical protein
MKFDLDLVGEDKPQSIEIRNGVLIHENAPAEKRNTRVVTVDRNSFIDAMQGRHVSGGLSGDDATFLERFGSLVQANGEKIQDVGERQVSERIAGRIENAGSGSSSS